MTVLLLSRVVCGRARRPLVIMIRGMVCAVPIIVLPGSCASSSAVQVQSCPLMEPGPRPVFPQLRNRCPEAFRYMERSKRWFGVEVTGRPNSFDL
ncbi:hypothetical protein HID58_031219 [Brassica napus]|uniref:Secreted protein n=1 Tax=Brassica napus TaxID=3708 RepID=A0ABQ8CIA8_BRANA|nr:hypothetical protein HID58_031219 [Brassica napus]